MKKAALALTTAMGLLMATPATAGGTIDAQPACVGTAQGYYPAITVEFDTGNPEDWVYVYLQGDDFPDGTIAFAGFAPNDFTLIFGAEETYTFTLEDVEGTTIGSDTQEVPFKCAGNGKPVFRGFNK